MTSGASPLVTVVGGAGVFGRLVVADLLERTGARVRLTARDAVRAGALVRDLGAGDRLEAVACDLADPASARRAVEGAAVVVAAAGPFQALGTAAFDAALAARAHYVDLADDRAHVNGLLARRAEAERAGIAALPGLSTVPGAASALVALLAPGLAAVTGLRAAFFVGAGNARGEGAAASALLQAGIPVPRRRAGRVAPTPALSVRRRFPFPPPIGPCGALPIDSPDLDLSPARYPSLRDLSIEVSFEDPFVGLGLQAFARARPLLAPPLYRAAARLALRTRGLTGGGSTLGALAVIVRGRTASGRDVRLAAALLARERGQRIAALPAAVGVARLLAGEGPPPGVHALVDWIEPRAFVAELEARGLELVTSPGKACS